MRMLFIGSTFATLLAATVTATGHCKKPAASDSGSPPSTPDKVFHVIAVKPSAALRTGPSASEKLIARIPYATRVQVIMMRRESETLLGVSGSWYEVHTGKAGRGFIFGPLTARPEEGRTLEVKNGRLVEATGALTQLRAGGSLSVRCKGAGDAIVCGGQLQLGALKDGRGTAEHAEGMLDIHRHERTATLKPSHWSPGTKDDRPVVRIAGRWCQQEVCHSEHCSGQDSEPQCTKSLCSIAIRLDDSSGKDGYFTGTLVGTPDYVSDGLCE